MKASFVATNAGEMEFSMTITMTLDHWRRLRQQLATAWTASELSGGISDMVSQAERNFHPNIKEQMV